MAHSLGVRTWLTGAQVRKHTDWLKRLYASCLTSQKSVNSQHIETLSPRYHTIETVSVPRTRKYKKLPNQFMSNNVIRLSFICHIHNYTEYNEEWNVFSAFNPSKCTHLEQWAANCAAPGEQSWTSCRSRDSNPQPWVTSGFKSNALSIRPTTELMFNKWNMYITLRNKW